MVGLRVLVADTHSTSRDILTAYLSSWRMHVDTVASRDDLLAALQGSITNPHRLVLIDTDLLGDDLATWMRRLPTSSTPTRLLLLIDFDEQLRARAAIEQGFNGYLTRPVKQSALFDAIMHAISETGAEVVTQVRSHTASAPRPGTILVAEDNPINQKLVLYQLRHLGYQAQAVSNGREVVDVLTTPPAGTDWSLILMDCQMPELDGFGATAVIREMEQRTGAHIPIVAMTANAMEGDREACLEAGMDDYLSKPVNMAQLRQVLERSLTVLSAPQAPPLDNQVLAELRTMVMDSAPDFVDELIDLFLTATPRLFTTMRDAIAAQDAQTLRRAAHECRGTSANLGANRLGELCGELEQLAQSQLMEDAAECLSRVEAEFQRVADALERERSTSQADSRLS